MPKKCRKRVSVVIRGPLVPRNIWVTSANKTLLQKLPIVAQARINIEAVGRRRRRLGECGEKKG